MSSPCLLQTSPLSLRVSRQQHVFAELRYEWCYECFRYLQLRLFKFSCIWPVVSCSNSMVLLTTTVSAGCFNGEHRGFSRNKPGPKPDPVQSMGNVRPDLHLLLFSFTWSVVPNDKGCTIHSHVHDAQFTFAREVSRNMSDSLTQRPQLDRNLL